MLKGWGTLIALFGACLIVPEPSFARPLNKKVCAALSKERTELAKIGIEKAIVKGPGWTNKNMPAGTLEKVRHYLSVEEKLRFRCSGIKVPDLAPEQTAAVEIKEAPKSKSGKQPDKKANKDVTGSIVKTQSAEKSALKKSKTAKSKEQKPASLQASLVSPITLPKVTTPEDTPSSAKPSPTKPSSNVPLPDRKPKRVAVKRRPSKKKAQAARPEPSQSISAQFNAEGGG